MTLFLITIFCALMPALASPLHFVAPLERDAPPLALSLLPRDLPCIIGIPTPANHFFTVCLFRNITQTLGTPSAPTRSVLLGTFANWTTDTTAPAKQIYQNGDVCPGFGYRYALVAFKCGTGTTNVSAVSEYDVCKYLITVTLGAWCAAASPGATPSPSSTQQLTPSPSSTQRLTPSPTGPAAPNAPAASSASLVYSVACISAAAGLVGAGFAIQRLQSRPPPPRGPMPPGDAVSVPNPASAASLRPAAGDVESLWQTAAEGGGGGAASDARAKALREALLLRGGDAPLPPRPSEQFATNATAM
jgi:hypothetical protein